MLTARANGAFEQRNGAERIGRRCAISIRRSDP
jgi:hypothetical protein